MILNHRFQIASRLLVGLFNVTYIYFVYWLIYMILSHRFSNRESAIGSSACSFVYSNPYSRDLHIVVFVSSFRHARSAGRDTSAPGVQFSRGNLTDNVPEFAKGGCRCCWLLSNCWCY
jgi:hypothetical protein